MNFKKNILITGGAGFIGSHLVKYLVQKYPHYEIINLDGLTYAGNLENLKDVEHFTNYQFIKENINNAINVEKIIAECHITHIIHLAAESHVDRSISSPTEFALTNVIGTLNLLQAAKKTWSDNFQNHLFYHVSTDEVFGSLGETGYFNELTPYDPRSPYSASKASSDHFVRAFYHTYHLPVVISNCSNNYGPYQFPEKLIPLIINNILNQKTLPVYGEGKNVRDWLWVGDHVSAIDKIFHEGTIGETYAIGGNSEKQNIELVTMLCDISDELLDRKSSSKNLIQFVKDRPGHDMRYAIDASKLKNELQWTPSMNLMDGLRQTVKWYLENSHWLKNVTSGNYLKYYETQYSK